MNNINIDATIDCISIENAKPAIIPIINNDKQKDFILRYFLSKIKENVLQLNINNNAEVILCENKV